MKNKQPLLLLLLLEVLVLTGAGKAAQLGAPRDPLPAEPLPSAIALRSSRSAEGGETPLRCWDCSSSVYGSDCYDIESKVDNETIDAVTRDCAPDEMCSVERVWYVVEGSINEHDFSVNRTCSSDCTPSCVVMGDRNKIHSCITCCSEHLCNVGRSSGSRHTTNPPLVVAALFAALGPALAALSTPAKKSLTWSKTLVSLAAVGRPLHFFLLGLLVSTVSSSDFLPDF